MGVLDPTYFIFYFYHYVNLSPKSKDILVKPLSPVKKLTPVVILALIKGFSTGCAEVISKENPSQGCSIPGSTIRVLDAWNDAQNTLSNNSIANNVNRQTCIANGGGAKCEVEFQKWEIINNAFFVTTVNKATMHECNARIYNVNEDCAKLLETCTWEGNTEDTDGDGLTNIDELEIYETNPCNKNTYGLCEPSDNNADPDYCSF